MSKATNIAMISTLPFDEHVTEYDEWYEKYPFVFQSEVEAIRAFLPGGKDIKGIEVALGTGRFSKALGIKEGIEPSANMRALAEKRGIDVLAGVAEHLPYEDNQYDFVLMAFCISYFENLSAAFLEARRVLKNGGALIVGFIDKDSIIGQSYEKRKPFSVFYKEATFYRTKSIIAELRKLNLIDLQFSQTLFHPLEEIRVLEPAKPGYGEGSFVLIRACK